MRHKVKPLEKMQVGLKRDIKGYTGRALPPGGEGLTLKFAEGIYCKEPF